MAAVTSYSGMRVVARHTFWSLELDQERDADASLRLRAWSLPPTRNRGMAEGSVANRTRAATMAELDGDLGAEPSPACCDDAKDLSDTASTVSSSHRRGMSTMADDGDALAGVVHDFSASSLDQPPAPVGNRARSATIDTTATWAEITESDLPEEREGLLVALRSRAATWSAPPGVFATIPRVVVCAASPCASAPPGVFKALDTRKRLRKLKKSPRPTSAAMPSDTESEKAVTGSSTEEGSEPSTPKAMPKLPPGVLMRPTTAATPKTTGPPGVLTLPRSRSPASTAVPSDTESEKAAARSTTTEGGSEPSTPKAMPKLPPGVLTRPKAASTPKLAGPPGVHTTFRASAPAPPGTFSAPPGVFA